MYDEYEKELWIINNIFLIKNGDYERPWIWSYAAKSERERVIYNE